MARISTWSSEAEAARHWAASAAERGLKPGGRRSARRSTPGASTPGSGAITETSS